MLRLRERRVALLWLPALALSLSWLAACASAPVREGESVLQFLDVRNMSGEPVEVTARVGTSPEQRLGFLGPAEFRRFEIATGASPIGTVFVRARNRDTGREATHTFEVSPGTTPEWMIRF